MKIPERLKELDFWIERIGFPTIICGFLAYLVFVRFGKIDKRFYHIIRNQEAIMRKLKIEVLPIVDEGK